jgi:antitoxin component YwqK of YwqJK toxin-antitoxin module
MRVLFFISTIVLLSFAASNCTGSQETQIPVEQVEMTDDYGNMEVYARRKSNYAKEGLYTKKSPQGTVLEQAFFKNDTLDGPRVLYYEQGDTQTVENYQKGLYIGPYRLYYPSGQLQQEGRYENNQMTGSWKQYYKNGQLKEIVQFEGNQENGPFVEYHENGALKAEGQYQNGPYEQGELKLYDEAGKLVRIMDCEQGTCRTQSEAEANAEN